MEIRIYPMPRNIELSRLPLKTRIRFVLAYLMHPSYFSIMIGVDENMICYVGIVNVIYILRIMRYEK